MLLSSHLPDTFKTSVCSRQTTAGYPCRFLGSQGSMSIIDASLVPGKHSAQPPLNSWWSELAFPGSVPPSLAYLWAHSLVTKARSGRQPLLEVDTWAGCGSLRKDNQGKLGARRQQVFVYLPSYCYRWIDRGMRASDRVGNQRWMFYEYSTTILDKLIEPISRRGGQAVASWRGVISTPHVL